LGSARELSEGPHWELKGRSDSATFFRGLAAALPGATTLFLEGSPVREVDVFLRAAAQPGPYLPETGTIWPKPRQYRPPFDETTLAGLAALAGNHAEPELCDHLHVYEGDRAVLEWYDAFASDSPASVAVDAAPDLLEDFADDVGFRLERR
jgi:hypothetical protein